MTTDRRSWLCIAYAFPPIKRSGTHRTLGFVRHLATMGWDATVITTRPGAEPIDEALTAQVPPSTHVLRVPWEDRVQRVKRWLGVTAEGSPSRPGDVNKHPEAKRTVQRGFRDWFTRLLHTPDSRAGWIRPAIQAGLETIQRDQPSIIFSTSPYVSAHLVALRLQRGTGLPWIADFRDPWRDNPFRARGYATLDWLETRWERAVLRSTHTVIMNTPTARDRLCARFPDLAGKCRVILNGFDPERFADVIPCRDEPPERFVIVHAGQFYGARSPLPLFAALRTVLRRSPNLANRLTLLLVGPEDFDGTPLNELARREGVASFVRVIGPRSHHESLSYLAGADAVFLAGSSGHGSELQIPAKLFEYLALKRPMVAALSKSSPAISILNEARAEAVVSDPDDIAGLAVAIEQVAHGQYQHPENAWSGIDQFAFSRRAKELCEIFNYGAVNTKQPTAEALGQDHGIGYLRRNTSISVSNEIPERTTTARTQPGMKHVLLPP